MVMVHVNGVAVETSAADVAALLAERCAETARVAVLLNDEVVPAVAHAATPLRAGDRVELLVFAGGG